MTTGTILRAAKAFMVARRLNAICNWLGVGIIYELSPTLAWHSEAKVSGQIGNVIGTS
jgi:hypothetical protein